MVSSPMTPAGDNLFQCCETFILFASSPGDLVRPRAALLLLQGIIGEGADDYGRGGRAPRDRQTPNHKSMG